MSPPEGTPLSRPRAAIFDFDGTLADSLVDLAAAMNEALERRGFRAHTVEAYAEFVGEGSRVMLERALPEGFTGDFEQVLSEYRMAYRRRRLDNTQLYPGIPALLDALTEKGIRLAVLSNKPDEDTKALATHLLSQWRFEVVLGERAGVPRKPDPTAALEIASAMGLPPSDFIFVGDTPTDVGTARSAGMWPVGVLWGFRSREALLEAGAKTLVAHPAELATAIASGSG